ncbi:MAG: O-antigen ligase family protein, partial [Lachnospiraceae bacterium]|nr:O-antigen ligase family protein [Lachnospiraceae bacterium]
MDKTKGKIKQFLTRDISPDIKEVFRDSNMERMAFFVMLFFAIIPSIISIYAMIIPDFERILSVYYALLKSITFKMVLVVALIVMIHSLISRKKDIILPTTLLFFAMIVWMVLSHIYQKCHGWEWYLSPYLNESIWTQILYVTGFYFLAIQINRENMKIWICRVSIIVSDVVAVAAFYLWQHMTFPVYLGDYTIGFAGIFTNINYYGYFLTVCIMLSAGSFVSESSDAWRKVSLASLILNSVALGLNDTLGAWIACGVGCVFLIIVYYIKDGHIDRSSIIATIAFGVSLILSSLFGGTIVNNLNSIGTDIEMIISQDEMMGRAGSGRLQIWIKTLELINNNP